MSEVRRPRWVAVVAVLLVLAALGGGLAVFLAKGTSELPVYTTGGARMLEGEEIYRPTDAKPFTYPPFFALPFVPFAWVPDSLHRAIWYLVNVASLVWIVVMLRRIALARRPAGRRERWLWILVLALAGRHVAATFQNQSHDLLVFLPLVLAARSFWWHRELRGGAWCGLAAACKATPLLFLPTFLGQLRVRAALGLLIALVAATLLPDLVLPRDDGLMWVVAWYDTFLGAVEAGSPAAGSGAWNAASSLNQNLAGSIYRLSVPVEVPGPFVEDVAIWHPSERTRKLVTLAAQLAVVAVIAFGAWPTRARGEANDDRGWRRIGEVGLVACGMVLLSPMSSKSHFCVLLLPAVFCAVELLWRRFRIVPAAFLVVAFVFGTLTSKGVFGRDLGNRILAMGSVAWSAVALLVATALLLASPRSRS